jgi:ABC-type transport system substrate-binding protein
MNCKKLLITVSIVLLLVTSVQAYALTSRSGAGGPVAGPLAGRAYVKITDSDAALTALLTGQIDMMGLTRKDQITAAEAAGFTILREPAQGLYNSFYFYWQHDIVNDLAFRRAVAHLLPKDELIATIYGPLAEYAVSVLGPSYGKWHNPNIEDYTEYDPDLAKYLLDQAGYTVNPATGKRIDPATRTDMRSLNLVYWPDQVNYATVSQRYAQELENVGIPITLVPKPFSTGEWYSAWVSTDWDIYNLGWSWSDYPEVLYVLFDSESPPDWLNGQRYSNPEYDAQMNIFHYSLNETAVVAAAWRAEEILAEDVAFVPFIYSVVHTAVSPDWIGSIESPFSSYTEALRIRSKSGDYSKLLRIRITEEPASLVVGYDQTAIADTYVDLVCHNMPFEYDPYKGPYKPWVINSWKLELWTDPALGVTSGTKLTVTMVDGLKFQDGQPCTAADYAFGVLYMRDKGVLRGSMVADKLIDAKAPSPTTVELYYNKTSLFVLDNQYYVLSFPKHIYNDNVTLYGEPAGIPAGTYSGQVGYGVKDPSTFYAFQVTNPYNTSLTCFVGCGPFIYMPGGWKPGVVFELVPNRQYFKSILVTDTNFDFKVDIIDIATAAKAFGTKPGDKRWSVTLDVNGDNSVDIIDIALIAKDFNKSW